MTIQTCAHVTSQNRPAANAPSPASFCIPSGIKKSVAISPEEFNLFSKYIYSITGIHIEPSKTYLLETRLGKLLESENCLSFSEFYVKVIRDSSKNLEKQIINAITTNETLFFRDSSPFELLKFKVLPELIDRRTAKLQCKVPIPLRIWSAACSTGQEIFSIAMVLKDMLSDLNKYSLHLLGTDLSDAAIRQASYGIYNKFEIERGLPRERLQRYFVSSGGTWKIADEIRSMATFRKINLMQPFVNLGRFDIIFCRNVAIYFTYEDRKKLFDKIADVLEPDGYLIIGATESLTGVCTRFVPYRHLKSIFYQLH